VVFIWVRHTLDWSDEEAVRAQLSPEIRPLVELWDATFSMPYHRFRHALREIARDNHARVEGACGAPWEEIPEGALVMPVDDDDWFAPDAARVVTAAHDEEGGDGVRWPSAFLEVAIDVRHTVSRVGRRLLPRVGPKWVCTTNNYALVKRPDRRRAFEAHVVASRAVAAGELRLAEAGRPLSLMNRTLASQTSLRRHAKPVDRAALLRKHRRYRELYDRDHDGWARPYVERMRLLTRELEVGG
jgi:hypothetical protein